MIKMEILFKNQTILNKSVTMETSKALLKPFIRPMLLIAAFVYIILAIYGYLLEDYILVILCLFLAPVMLITRTHVYRSNGSKAYKQQKVLFGDKDPIINITVYEDYLQLSEDGFKTTKNSLLIDTSNLDASIPHNRITSVYKTKTLFVIVYGKQFALTIEKAKFTTG
ncbi:hypothetical protein [Turicibacter sanguinis]|uniref:hypothetical protein n=1 Tax=Turicibacter sanguinis TaxID=154288 RepID=UPI00399B464D